MAYPAYFAGSLLQLGTGHMSRWPMALRGKKSSEIARSSNGKRFRLALTLPRHRAITRLLGCCEISHRASVRPSSQSSASLANSVFTSSALIAPTVLHAWLMRFLGLSAQAVVFLRLRRAISIPKHLIDCFLDGWVTFGEVSSADD